MHWCVENLQIGEAIASITGIAYFKKQGNWIMFMFVLGLYGHFDDRFPLGMLLSFYALWKFDHSGIFHKYSYKMDFRLLVFSIHCLPHRCLQITSDPYLNHISWSAAPPSPQYKKLTLPSVKILQGCCMYYPTRLQVHYSMQIRAIFVSGHFSPLNSGETEVLALNNVIYINTESKILPLKWKVN